MARRGKQSGGKGHRFGGDWTTTKLAILARYLRAYTTALKHQPFLKAYIDAFAGTGYRDAQRDNERASTAGLLFPDLAEEEPKRSDYLMDQRDSRSRSSLRSTATSLSSAVRIAASTSSR